MSDLAAQLVAAEHLWRPYVRHDAEARFYQQLYRDPNLDVWLICWVDGQNTGYHDHDRSSGAVCVCDGMLLEDWFRVEEDGWVRERTTEHGAGGRFDFDASDIHGVRHPGPDAPPATSIHLYSPALWRMGHYEPGPRGHATGRHDVRGRASRRGLSSTLSRLTGAVPGCHKRAAGP